MSQNLSMSRITLIQNEQDALARTMDSIQHLRATVFDFLQAWQNSFSKKEAATLKLKSQLTSDRKNALQQALNSFKLAIKSIPEQTVVCKSDSSFISKSIVSSESMIVSEDLESNRFSKFQELAASARRDLESGIDRVFPDLALRMWTWKLSNRNSRQIQLSDQSSPLLRMLHQLESKHQNLSIARIARPGTAADLQGLHVTFASLFRLSISFPVLQSGQDSRSIAYRIDRVNIRGFNESTNESDLWEVSSLKVFAKLTSFATTASEYFVASLPTSIDAIRQFIIWLGSYEDLFSCTCASCGFGLIHDSHEMQLLPPLVRDFSTGTPYHPQCYRNRTLS